MRRIFLAFLLVFTTVLPAGDIAQKIDGFVKDCYERGLFNGNVLVARKGKIVYQQAFGLADPSSGARLGIDNNFNLASVSKQFTAMAVMVLKERGKLEYDNEITRFLPGLPYPGITIRHLLNHTSGLPDYMALFAKHWDVDRPDPLKKTASNADIVALLKQYAPPRDFEPGSRWAYSNTGYCLLASIVEAASGLSFPDFLKQNVFDPLEMKQTLVYSKIKNPPIPNRTYGFLDTLDGKGHEPNDLIYLDGIYGDGAIYANLGDLFKWDQALYTEKPVSRATINEAFSPARLNDGSTHPYGFGWGLLDLDGQKAVAHSGGWVGFRTYILRRIESGDVVIVLANNTVSNAGRIARAIDLILHGKAYEPIKTPISLTIGKILLEKGEEPALAAYEDLKKTQPDSYDFAEWNLNILGYRLLEAGKNEAALAALKLNLREYPKSVNAHDSLGDAYFRMEQWRPALEFYQKALTLDGKNENAAKRIEEIKSKIPKKSD